jgi:NADH-quinone oxidoreductase subunit A
MGISDLPLLPIFLFAGCVVALAVVLLVMGNLFNPRRPTRVKRMPYESGMDPFHDTRRRFDVRFYLLAIAFLVFYPWAVTARPARLADSSSSAGATAEDAETTEAVAAPATSSAAVAALQQSEAGQEFIASRHAIFGGVMVFLVLLTLGFVYDWRKGVFQWR